MNASPQVSPRDNLVKATEIDRDSLCLLMELSTGGSDFKVRRQIERVRKAFSRGELFIPPNETEQHRWWRCEARMMLGDYSDWSGWEYRDNWAATLWHNKPFDRPAWNGLPTDCLYVIGEQGCGDILSYASCIPDCTAVARKVILECDERLRSICERSFGIETTPSKIVGDKRIKQDLPGKATAWMGLADLPRMWRRDISHFPGTPYLKADIEQGRRFDDYRGSTGISWRGAQGEEPELRSLFPDAVSLQYDQAWDEETKAPEGLDLRNDIEGILGLLCNLDRVVTVSTSVAHFAASLGIETHVVIADKKTARRPHIFPFRWVCRATPGRTPWYGSARIYSSLREFKEYNSR